MLNDTLVLELADGTDLVLSSYDCLVVLSSYDCLQIKQGKVISFAPHIDVQVNIKPVDQSRAS